MATVTVGIIGLGRIGASVALALKRYNARKDAQHSFEIVCADPRASVRDEAVTVGAASQVERDPYKAAQNRDILVLALPYADVQAVYRDIGRDVRPGAVVLDFSALKQPPLEWAKTYLAPDAHMVGVAPVLNPKYLFDGLDDTLHAQADLFDNGAMLLMPGVSAVRDAVELAADFATLLGAKPHFADPAEHDSLAAISEGMPALVGVALFYTIYKGRGWNDAQRLTNPAFGRLTHHLYDTHPDDLRDMLLQNRDNLVRQIDSLTATLQAFRGILAHNDRHALEAALIEASDAYSAWINRRTNARWDEADKPAAPAPTFGGMLMTGLMGGFLSKKLGGKNGGGDKS